MNNTKNTDGPIAHQRFNFEEAYELMKKNASKFLSDNNFDSSSSEDELDDSLLVQKTFSHYSSDDDSNSILKTREYLLDILTSGAIVCLICIESIKRHDKIWSCHYCYGMFHLHCIQKWAKDSIYHHSTDTEENSNFVPKWCCPKCRTKYVLSTEPLKYLCFCGKVENPIFDIWNVPHSCGKTCGKYLKPNCSHTCSLLCHPGPCPPCPQTVLISCCCSKSKPTSRRCSNKEWSCGKQCEKPLPCQLHFCEAMCHIGPCTLCKKQSKQKCMCGSKMRLQPCDSPTWHCDKICGKPLKCGNHFCQIVCHEGFCSNCPNSGLRSCPCGKTFVSLPCTELVMPCGDTCNRLLECELHHCNQRCHFGSCEKCLQMRIMKCRCGQKEKSVPCCKEYVCDIKCKRRRDCGKHFCNRKCCIGNCPPCEVPCGKTLNCGHHKCSSICHPGPCYPCRETVCITCNCSMTKVTIPCGRKKSAVPPRCSADCKLAADCHHLVRQNHQCHFGACPPCRLVCNKTLSCGHNCLAKCHSAVLTKIELKSKKAGPWDLINSYKTKLMDKPCPPCNVPVQVLCLGGHEILNFPCHEARTISCGRPCGRKLLCGNHFCEKECHSISKMNDDNLQSNECESCEEICKKPRKFGCTHPCLKLCHPGDCTSCQQSIKMKCHCEINMIYIACSEWIESDERQKDKLMSCCNRCPKQMSCGHRCNMLCHAGKCGSAENCKKKITLRCPCKRQKKEIHCFTQLKNPVILACDKECIKLQDLLDAAKLENDLKQKEEEKKKQEQELRLFLRKTEGKKRKKKKHSVDNSSYKYTVNFMITSVAIVCITGMLIFIMIKW